MRIEPPARSNTGQDGARVSRSLALLAVTFGGLGLALGALFLVDDPQSFVLENSLPRDQRLQLVAVVLGSVLFVLLVSAVVLVARKDAGARALEVAAIRWSPLGLSWAVLALALNHVWRDHALTFLVVLGATLLLLERSLWMSGMTFSHHFLDALSIRYNRLSPLLRRSAPAAFVLVGACGYAAYTGYWSVQQHHRLATASFDLGIIDNVMFNTMRGHPFRATILFGPGGGSLLAGHANFVAYLFVPFYWMWPKAETLLIIQSILLGFCAVPLYGFAKTKIPRWSAALVSVAFLLCAPLHGMNFYDFHFLPVSMIFLFSLFWALATNRGVLVWLFFALCVSVREDVPVGLAALGVFLVVTGYRVRTGAVMAVLSTIAFVLIKFVIMTSAGTWWFANLYDDLMAEGERNYLGVVLSLLSNPMYVASTLLTEKKLIYALHIFAPLVFLPLRRWSYLWLLFPGFFFTLLTTNYAPTVSISFQYTSHWLPYVFAASVLALAAMGRSPSGVVHRRAALTALLLGITLHSLAFGAVLRPTRFVGGFQRIPFAVTDAERERYQDLREIIAMIPPDASVAATDPESPHITNRLTAYAFRTGAGDAEYLLVRRFVRSNARKNAQRALDEHSYGLVAEVGDFRLFKRGHESPETEAALRRLGLRARPKDE
jgi:uncharacterized membrane protein